MRRPNWLPVPDRAQPVWTCECGCEQAAHFVVQDKDPFNGQDIEFYSCRNHPDCEAFRVAA